MTQLRLTTCLMTCLMVAALLVSGCAALERVEFDPELDDLDLTIEVLKSENREAKRLIMELRRDVAARRKELGTAHVKNGQLEGRVREAERHYVEAREVVELQREELARLRDERAVVVRTRTELQGEMRKLRKQLSRLILRREGKVPRRQNRKQEAPPRPARPRATSHVPARSDGMPVRVASFQAEAKSGGPAPVMRVESPGTVVVRRGDWLWDIARRYAVDVWDLIAMNESINDPSVIHPGQILRLPPRIQ